MCTHMYSTCTIQIRAHNIVLQIHMYFDVIQINETLILVLVFGVIDHTVHVPALVHMLTMYEKLKL